MVERDKVTQVEMDSDNTPSVVHVNVTIDLDDLNQKQWGEGSFREIGTCRFYVNVAHNNYTLNDFFMIVFEIM